MSITVTISVQVTDPNCAYVIGTAPSKEIFFEFFTSPERQEIQDSGIIISQPEIAILEEA